MLFNQEKTNLSSKEFQIVRELKKNGIAVVHISDLFPQTMFEELQQYVKNRWEHPEVIKKFKSRHEAVSGGKLLSKEYFLVNLWEGESVLNLANPFIRFSLDSSVLRIVNSYLSLLSKFRGWHLQITVPMPKGDRRYGSQEWHRDPEDKKLIKMFLYLNDVDEGAGPFVYLKGSQEGGKWRHLFPQNPPRGSAGNDIAIPQEDLVQCTGKIGTVILCDTSGLHRGGYATSGNRFMYTSVYTTPASVWPIIFKYPPHLESINLSNQASYAVLNNPLQREPRFYKF